MSDFAGALREHSEAFAVSILRGIWGLRVTGLDGVPRAGSLIFACNHVSVIDPPLLACAVGPARRPYFLGKKELFSVPLLSSFLCRTGVIPLERGTADHSAMRAALEALESGASLAIFPEGTRVRPGETRAPKAGVSFLASRTGAPVVPVRVLGTAAFPRAFPLEVRFGSPLAAPPAGREAASSFARTVMDAIRAL